MTFQEMARQRSNIKERVEWATSSLGPIMAVVPGGEPLRSEVDQLLQELESMSPTDKPLNVKVRTVMYCCVLPLPILIIRVACNTREQWSSIISLSMLLCSSVIPPGHLLLCAATANPDDCTSLLICHPPRWTLSGTQL